MTSGYIQDGENSIRFFSDRRPGDVRIPNYVYDIWMPILGFVAIGVYSTYCRLEHGESVKGITMKTLATAGRIGLDRLAKINDLLERYGFITVAKPTGMKIVMHWTNTITIHDPPMQVDMEWMRENYPEDLPSDYRPLSPWLIQKTENPNGYTAEYPSRNSIVYPNGNANIEPFIVESFISPLPGNATVAEAGCAQPEKQSTNPYPKMATPSTIRPLPKIKAEEPGRKKAEVEPLSNLEKSIDSICQGMSLIHQPNIRKLLKEPVIIDGATYGSPESLWPDKDFQRYVEERLNWARGKDNGKSSQKGIVALIRKYETPTYGWLCRAQSVTSVSEIAARLREEEHQANWLSMYGDQLNA